MQYKGKKFHTPQGRVRRAPFSIVEDMAAVSLAAQELQAVSFPRIVAVPLTALERYHVGVHGLHPDYLPAMQTLTLTPSQHAVEKAQVEGNRRHVEVYLPTVLDLAKTVIIEQGVYRGVLDRLLVRVRHDKVWDLVMSLYMRTGQELKGIITVWLNEVGDYHRTLDRSAYLKP